MQPYAKVSKNLSPNNYPNTPTHVINFNLPIPGSTTSSDSTVNSNNNYPSPSPHLIKLHLPIPGSTTSSDTTVHSDSSIHNVNHLLTEIQSGFHPPPTNPVKPNIHQPFSMEDTISSSSSEYIPSDDKCKDEEEDIDEERNPPPNDDEEEADANTSFGYTNLATSLITSNNANFNFTTEEESLIKGSTVNTFKYTKSKAGTETRFFDTIKQFGGPEMQPLLEDVEQKKLRKSASTLFYEDKEMNIRELY